MKNQKLVIVLTAIMVIASFAFGGYVYKTQQAQELGFMASKNAELFIRDHSPVLGNKDAKVFIVEFLDPECESCRSFYPYVKKIMAQHEGKVKLVVRYTPFHKNSKFAIRILEATRKQGKFWESLGLLFHYQPKWGNHHNPRPELIWDILPLAGVDIKKVKEDMNDPATKTIIEQDVADGKTLKVRATPTFFINGKPLQSFGYEQLKKAIDDEVKKHY